MAIHDKYTEKEIQFIIDNYNTMSIAEMSEFIHRDTKSIQCKMYRLGLKKTNKQFANYTQEEDELIRQLYNNTTYSSLDKNIGELIKKYMPYRTIDSVKNRANRLGLFIRNEWTEEEDNYLRNHYYDMSVNELTIYFKTHSRESVYNRIKKLGLSGAYMFAFTEHEKEFIQNNYLNMTDSEMSKILGRSSGSIKTYRSNHGLLKPKTKNVVYNFETFLKRHNDDWKQRSAEYCGYKCIVTGAKFDEIHHLYSKNLIINDMLNKYPEWEINDINQYSVNDKQKILDAFLLEQESHGLGVCLCKDVHMLFHNKYGYGNNTPEQFYNFIKEIAPNRFDEIINI